MPSLRTQHLKPLLTKYGKSVLGGQRLLNWGLRTRLIGCASRQKDSDLLNHTHHHTQHIAPLTYLFIMIAVDRLVLSHHSGSGAQVLPPLLSLTIIDYLHMIFIESKVFVRMSICVSISTFIPCIPANPPTDR